LTFRFRNLEAHLEEREKNEVEGQKEKQKRVGKGTILPLIYTHTTQGETPT
jgi:hypothetical protein